MRRELASRAPATPITPTTPAINEAPNHQSAQASALSADGSNGNGINEHPQPHEASEARSTAGPTSRFEEQHALAEAQRDIPHPSIEVSRALLYAGYSC